jgi:hypothetical protein
MELAGKRRKLHRKFFKKTRRKKTTKKTYMWYKFKRDLRGILWENVDCILYQDSWKWCALMNTVMNLLVALNDENFF